MDMNKLAWLHPQNMYHTRLKHIFLKIDLLYIGLSKTLLVYLTVNYIFYQQYTFLSRTAFEY